MSPTRSIVALLFLVTVFNFGEGKIFGRCEFARTLKQFGVPFNQIATWVCIAKHESNYDTKAINHQSGDHGIFQISQIYWCSITNTPGKGCHTTCAKFEDDDIRDDNACAQKVYNEWQKWKGNGFMAWTTYKYCRGDVSRYIAGCFK